MLIMSLNDQDPVYLLYEAVIKQAVDDLNIVKLSHNKRSLSGHPLTITQEDALSARRFIFSDDIKTVFNVMNVDMNLEYFRGMAQTTTPKRVYRFAKR